MGDMTRGVGPIEGSDHGLAGGSGGPADDGAMDVDAAAGAHEPADGGAAGGDSDGGADGGADDGADGSA